MEGVERSAGPEETIEPDQGEATSFPFPYKEDNMANIKKIEGKNGVTFKITVTTGRDINGKQVRHYKTWTPDRKMTERQLQKAVEKAAMEFEQEIEMGYQTDNRQTFSEYFRYVIGLKEQSGVKHRTVFLYKSLLERCDLAIGHLKLVDIRPHHLNAFYKNLMEEGVRKNSSRAIAKVDIKAYLKSRGITKVSLAEQSGVSIGTLDNACNGKKILLSRAELLCKALNKPVDALFEVARDMRPLATKTQLEYHRFIHTVLDQAEREMIVPYNAAEKAVAPKVEKKEVNYFQADEITAILDALEKEPIKWRAITHLLIVTGCRRGEIAGLRWEKIDFEKKQIRIDATLLYTPERGIYESETKTGDTRLLSLPPETMTLLREYRAWYTELRLMNGDRWNNSGFVFVKDDGRPMQPDSIGGWLVKFYRRHNLPKINPHAFRHTVASVLINSGTDVVSVSKRLGHARTSTTTDIYAHIMQQADQQASECLADALLRRKKA